MRMRVSRYLHCFRTNEAIANVRDVFVVSVDSHEHVDTRMFTSRGSPLKVIKKVGAI